MSDFSVARNPVDFADVVALATEGGVSRIADNARDYAARAAAGRLFVTLLGQFKRGKSTLINTLVGDDVLPIGVVPVTSVVTVLRFGAAKTVRVQYADGRGEFVPPGLLLDYVSEARNPDNRRQVSVVEVFLPSPILADGLNLVDTPGVGSVGVAATEETRRFIPHIDAAVVVLGSDPPITQEELTLIEAVARETPTLLFVLNKADKSSASELDEARVFTARIVEHHLRHLPTIFVVSAAEARTAATRDWPLLVDALHALVARKSGDITAHRQRRVAVRLLRELRVDVAAQRRALVDPLERTAARVQALQGWIDDVAIEARELSSRLTGWQTSLDPVFDQMRQDFLRTRLPRAVDELARALDGIGDRHFHRDAVAAAQRIAEREIDDWIDLIEPEAARHYSHVTERFVTLANALLTRLFDVEPALGELPPLEADTTFRLKRGFFFTSMTRLTGGAIIASALTGTGLDAARQRVARRVTDYLTHLLEVNSTRVYEDLRYRVGESRRSVETDVRNRLNELSQSASRALARATEIRQAGEDAVRSEDDRLRQLLATIDSRLAAIDDRLEHTPEAQRERNHG